MDLKMLRTHLS